MTSSLAITAISTMLIMAFGIIFFVVMYQRRVIKHQEDINKINRQKELELVQAAVRGEEEERTRIAAELHDDVGATLASVKLFLRGQDKGTDNNPGFNQSKELIDETINKVRNLSHRLQPAVLKQFGLDIALKSFFDSFKDTAGITINYTQQQLPVINDDKELAAYRIVQELMNNTVKHAEAAFINCHCEAGTGNFIIIFSHDGHGLTEETFQQQLYKKDAIGLKNIVTRLKAVNGNIAFKQDGNTYTTQITIPL